VPSAMWPCSKSGPKLQRREANFIVYLLQHTNRNTHTCVHN